MTNASCLNCFNPIEANQKFCSQCGQKTVLHRLSLHELAHEAIHYFTHADKGIFQLLKALVLRTGTVAREYVTGRRKKYFPPLNFFLLVAAIYVLTSGLFIPKLPAPTSTTSTQQSVEPNKGAKPATYSIKERGMRAFRFLGKYSNYVSMMAAPLISLLVWLCYYKGRFNFTEHLVANLYLIGFTNLVRCLLFTPVLYYLHIRMSFGANLIFVAFEVVYRTIFYYHFMGGNSKKAMLVSAGVSTATAVFWMAAISFFVWLYIITGV